MGPTGIIIGSRDASALAAAWERFYGLDATVRRELGVSAREQIVGRYALTAVRGTLQALDHWRRREPRLAPKRAKRSSSV